MHPKIRCLLDYRMMTFVGVRTACARVVARKKCARIGTIIHLRQTAHMGIQAGGIVE